MQVYLLLPLLSGIAAVALASAILARDPGQRVNRLVALALACSAYWSLCEIGALLAGDATAAASWIRASSLGWLWLGPLCLHILLEIHGDARSRLRRLVPFAYAGTAAVIPFYALTPWFVREALPASFGWGLHFGRLFPLPYLGTLVCVTAALFVLPPFLGSRVSRGERRQARWLFAAIALPTGLASLTDALLPYFDVQVPRLGSASLLVLGGVVGWSVRRDGYLLLAPGAFTQEILETLRGGVALLRADGSIRYCNGGLARLVGVAPEQLRGVAARELLPELGDDPCREIRELETELAPDSAAPIPVSVASSPLRDQTGRTIGSVLALHDTRDVVALRGRLVTAGRLAAVGELAAGIAHEINNPITFVRSNLVELRRLWSALPDGAEKLCAGDGIEALVEEGFELIEESVEGVDRVTAIVRDVGAFAHAGLGQSELADLNELVETAANVAALRCRVTVERCYGELPAIRCAPHQLRQLFLNLLFNALQAVDHSGRIRLTTQAAGDSVLVRVEDDGCGMPPEVLERIFDPFFTTRPAGEGTGLGLSLAYQIVRNHRGEISADSQPGRGTRFLIRLPIDADASA